MSDQLLIEIRVRPNSSRNKVGGTVGDPARLVVAVQAPAVDGKANEALTSALAQRYSLAMLLNRVFQTNWPAGAFNKMREELHPKVTAGIFGGETDDN